MKTLCSLVLVLALVPLAACAPKVNDPADVQAIRQLMSDYLKAISAGDAAAVVAAMNDKTAWFEPHMAPLVGKDAIRKLHEQFVGAFTIGLKLEATDVQVAGPLATARGTYTQTLVPKEEGLAAIKDRGNWSATFHRGADGKWQWDSCMAASDQPMPGTTADGADEQALADIERGFIAAMKNRDMAFFERVLAKEYTQVTNGKPVNMAEQLTAIKTGQVQIESVAFHDLRVHVLGDAAIVSMAGETAGTYKGKPFSERLKGVDLFVRRDGRWQVVHSQATTITP